MLSADGKWDVQSLYQLFRRRVHVVMSARPTRPEYQELRNIQHGPRSAQVFSHYSAIDRCLKCHIASIDLGHVVFSALEVLDDYCAT